MKRPIRRNFSLLDSLFLLITFLLCSQVAVASPSHRHDSDDAEKEAIHQEFQTYALKEGETKVEIATHLGGPRFVVSRVGRTFSSEDSLVAAVERLGGLDSPLTFSLHEGKFVSNEILPEPHSFTVDFTLSSKELAETFTYSQVEQRIRIPTSMQEKLGIVTKEARPAILTQTLRANGRVIAPHDKIAHVFPRFPGVVKAGHKHTGDFVKRGDSLAEIESNLNLRTYTLTSPIDGQIIEGHLVPGEFVPQTREVFTVINLEEVWIDFLLPPSDVSQVVKNASITITLPEEKKELQTRVDLLFPVADPSSQLLTARAVLENRDGELHPGHIVQGEITVESVQAPVTVDRGAVQRMGGNEVIFVTDGESFEPAIIQTGRRSRGVIEVTNGLPKGTKYASSKTFLLKAEIQKDLAHHSH